MTHIPDSAFAGNVAASELPAITARLWAKTEKSDGCWVWTGYRRNGEHGSMSVHDEEHYVHRLSWQIHFGPIPSGQNVLHRCDNPPCVRPGHLFLGTQVDNVRDMLEKQRGSPPPIKRGLNNWQAVLTDEQVADIRRAVAQGEKQRDVAARFGCSQSTVWRLAHGHTRTAGDGQ